MRALLRIAVFFLILCNLPGYLLAYISPVLGTLSSYSSTLLLLLYFLTTRQHRKPLWPFILLALTYFLISGLNVLHVPEMVYIKEFIRFSILVFCAVEILYDAKRNEIYIPLLIGAVSIIVNAIVFPRANVNFTPDYGRFSGFYLNPNYAGAICLIGYALTYRVKPIWFRLLGQLIFTMGGLFTFSRTFIVTWLFINLLAALQKRSNLLAPAAGAMVLVIFISISSGLNVNRDRFRALEGIFSGDTSQTQTRTITEDSRTKTWSMYTGYILDKPLFGNGYANFKLKHSGLPGVHNSYLLVIGEGGIIPFLIMVSIYIYLLISTFRMIHSHPEYFYITVVLSTTLLASHQYFDTYYNVLISMYVFIQIRIHKNRMNDGLVNNYKNYRNEENLAV